MIEPPQPAPGLHGHEHESFEESTNNSMMRPPGRCSPDIGKNQRPLFCSPRPSDGRKSASPPSDVIRLRRWLINRRRRRIGRRHKAPRGRRHRAADYRNGGSALRMNIIARGFHSPVALTDCVAPRFQIRRRVGRFAPHLIGLSAATSGSSGISIVL